MVTVENTFASFTGTPYGNAIYRGGVDAIARHAGKLHARSGDPSLEVLLNDRPNPYMTPYNLLYKVCTAYYVHGNAFILLDRSGGRIRGLYPLLPSHVEFMPGADGSLLIKCGFPDGNEATFPYPDVVHLRRHFLGDDLLGEDSRPIRETLDTAETLTQGMSKAVRNGNAIKGILQYEGVMNPDQIRTEKERFVRDYLGIDNAGGIAAIDKKVNFHPAGMTPYTIPREQADLIRDQVLSYLGISQGIVSGNFTEDEFSSFYEAVIEPFALQLSQELTEKAHVEVAFTSDRMEFSAAKTKITLLHEAGPLGVMTINEARQLLALPPTDGGDERLQSLNYISARRAGAYQTGRAEDEGGDDDGQED